MARRERVRRARARCCRLRQQRRQQQFQFHAAASKSSSGGSVTLNGAGSTFAAPIYQQVGSDLKGQGMTVNYQSVGSGAGRLAVHGRDGRLRRL